MTTALITVDTELSPMGRKLGWSLDDNLAISVFGETAKGAFGIRHQLQRLAEHGLKASFFVEALCSQLYGLDVLKRMVEPILTAGQEVQLHCHIEWLQWVEGPLRQPFDHGHMAKLDRAMQRTCLELGIEALERAGAPRPNAFRAGSYAANNDTLRAAADVGLTFSTNYNEAMRPGAGGTNACRLEIEPQPRGPVEVDGVVEVPITCFADYPGHVRPAQLAAASANELRHIGRAAARGGYPTYVIVSHGFELIDRIRRMPLPLVVRRFDRLCAFLDTERHRLPTGGFRHLDAHALTAGARWRQIVSNPLRTSRRMVEQGLDKVFLQRPALERILLAHRQPQVRYH